MPFGLCNAPGTFRRLMQNCLGELNLTYCLIYLDNVIVFLKMEEEHLHNLHVVFNCFWEHNVRLKPTKCKFFQDEINYLAHHVSEEGVQLNKENLKAMAEFTPPWPYKEIWAFWAWWGTIGHLSRGLHVLCNPYNSIYLGKVPIDEWLSNAHGGGQGCLWDS